MQICSDVQLELCSYRRFSGFNLFKLRSTVFSMALLCTVAVRFIRADPDQIEVIRSLAEALCGNAFFLMPLALDLR